MTGSVVTASFVMAALGALYFLSGSYVTHAKTFVQTGVVAGAIACALMIFPTGDGNENKSSRINRSRVLPLKACSVPSEVPR